MPAAATRLAIFDCDGTLVDGQANICTAMERAFAAAGAPAPTRDAIRRIVGLSVPEALRALSPGADAAFHAEVGEAFKTMFRAMRASGEAIDEPLFDGMAEALDALTADGWQLGVATGKSDRGLAHVLAHHGIADRFVTLQTADRHPSKPHPAMLQAALTEAGALPQDSVMIGDTSFDMAMALAAGVRAIGVAWGYHPVGELCASGAEAVAQRCDELPGLLASRCALPLEPAR